MESEEEVCLPKATLSKMIQETLSSDMTCSKEARDLIADCCMEFVHLVSSEANDISEKDSKKTILGEHVIAALKSLGFEEYLNVIQQVFSDFQKDSKDREKRFTRLENSGIPMEELSKQQEILLENARISMQK